MQAFFEVGGATPLSWLWPILAAPFVGSLLGVLIIRLPAGRNVGWARSECESCHRPLTSMELLPILSFVALRGRCRSCQAPIARFHIWIELAAILVAVSAVWAARDPAMIWANCVLGWTLLALAWIDFRHLLLPDALTLPLVLAGLAATLWLDPDAITSAASGALVGYLAFRAVEWAYRALRHRDGLGQGDAKLMAAAGAWVGLENLGLVILTAALFGIAAACLKFLIGRGRVRLHLHETQIPFGPWIALAAWFVRLYVS